MPKKVTIYQLTADGSSQAFEVWDHVAEEALAAHPDEYAMQPWPVLQTADTKKAEETIDKPKKRASKKDKDAQADAQEAGGDGQDDASGSNGSAAATDA